MRLQCNEGLQYLLYFCPRKNKLIMNTRIPESIQESIDIKRNILSNEALMAQVQAAADVMAQSLRAGGKVHFCGNGGSAADAQHLAAELSGRFYYDRPPLNAEALHCNTSYLTAVGNDYGYDLVFSRLLRGTAKKGDVIVGISTSGNSKNILEAFKAAKEMGLHIVAMTGESGGEMKTYADILLNVPSTDTPRIQECHILLGHIFCELVEADLFPRR